jgi:hypothetical protein
MKNDKFLIGIIVGVVILVGVALALVLIRGQNEAYVADDSPTGVVHNYFLAIQRKDYERAYRYLSDDLKNKPDLDEFIQGVGNQYGSAEEALQIGETTQQGNERSQVDVGLTAYQGGDIFNFDGSGNYTRHENALLRLNANNEWKLTYFPYPYWGYEWDQNED